MDEQVNGAGRRPEVAPLYRLGSNHSNASVFEDVEMAQDEVRKPTAIVCRPVFLIESLVCSYSPDLSQRACQRVPLHFRIANAPTPRRASRTTMKGRMGPRQSSNTLRTELCLSTLTTSLSTWATRQTSPRIVRLRMEVIEVMLCIEDPPLSRGLPFMLDFFERIVPGLTRPTAAMAESARNYTLLARTLLL